MRYTIASLLALCLTTASAFRDTSPYVLLSTSELPSTLKEFSSRQLQRQEDVVDASLLFLDTCPSDTYLIISQPGVRASDLSRSKAVPHLREMISNKGLRTKFSISEVSGVLQADQLGRPIASKCGALEMQIDPNQILDALLKDEFKPMVVYVDLPMLPTANSERVAQLVENDYLLNNVFNALPSKYTIIYTTSPPSDDFVHDTPPYQPDFAEPLHSELKRRSAFAEPASNATEKDPRPLFEKYQFFSPGLFMAIVVGIVLFSILSVGLSALSSLQVSYGAFDKEMGPAAQKKLQ